MAYTAGTLVSATTTTTGATRTIVFTPTAAGNVFVLGIGISSAALTVSSVVGTNTTSAKLTSVADSTMAYAAELWAVTVGAGWTSGSISLTVTWSSSASGIPAKLIGRQHSAGLGSATVWSLDTGSAPTAAKDNTTASTAMPFNTMTGSTTGLLAVGWATPTSSTSAAGSTSGSSSTWVWDITTDVDYFTAWAYSLSTGATSQTVPSPTQSSSAQSTTLSALLSATATAVDNISGALTGSGTLTGAPVDTTSAGATLTGSGTLTAAATQVAAETASLTASGQLTAAAGNTVVETGTLAGSGTLTGVVNAGLTAALAGSGTLAGTLTDTVPMPGNLAGSGTVTATLTLAQQETASLTASGLLTGAVGFVQSAAGTLAASGLLTAAAATTDVVSASLTGAGVMTASPSDTTRPTGALSGAGLFTANLSGVYVPYVPEGWTDNSLATPVSAARMNYMESGLVQIDNAQQGKAPLLVPTLVKSSAYSANVTDLVPVDLSGASVAVTLPSAPADKSQIAVQVAATGTGNSCTVVTAGVDVFDRTGGGTTKTLALLGEFVVLEYKASGAIWYSIASGAPRASLDGRYVQTVTAGDSTVTVAGTATAPTVKVASIAESQVTNLTTDLAAKAPLASPTFTGTVTVPHVAASGSAPTIAAGANNGTTPPTPTVTGNDTRGTVSFGSGTSPAIGAQIVVTFNSAFSAAPVVTFTATKSALQALNPYISAITTTSFTLSTTVAPTASQAATVYAGNYIAVG